MSTPSDVQSFLYDPLPDNMPFYFLSPVLILHVGIKLLTCLSNMLSVCSLENYKLLYPCKEAEHGTLGLCVFILLMQPIGNVFSCETHI